MNMNSNQTFTLKIMAVYPPAGTSIYGLNESWVSFSI